MNKYKAFIDFVRSVTVAPMPIEFEEILEELQELADQPEKPELTESGMAILEYLQQQETKNFKAKDISEGMNISSRKISGAMRKLATDGFVLKHSKNPVIYCLSDKGKNFDLKEFKEKINNEENN